MADQQARLGRQQPADRPDQARLTDASLPRDEHQPALAGRRLAGGLGELSELALAFEKHRPCHIASIAGDWTRDHVNLLGSRRTWPAHVGCSPIQMVKKDLKDRVALRPRQDSNLPPTD